MGAEVISGLWEQQAQLVIQTDVDYAAQNSDAVVIATADVEITLPSNALPGTSILFMASGGDITFANGGMPTIPQGTTQTATFGNGGWAPATATGALVSVANAAALTAYDVTGLSTGDKIYVETYRADFTLQPASTLRPNEVLASTDAGFVWVRDLGPSVWTYQYSWFYDKDSGSDEADGGTRTTPIKTLDEFFRRVRAWSAGTNGTLQQYTMTFLTAVASTDTFAPTGFFQSDGVLPTTNFVQPSFIGFRRVISVPSGSGALTAASTLAATSTNTKATLTDANAVFTTLIGKMVMCADTATAASGTGAVASITSVTAGIATLTGGTGFTTGSVNRLIAITGAATGANNGTFPITRFISATSVEYHNPNAVAPDANNGAITWVEKNAKICYVTTAPTFTNGTGITVSAISAGIATLVGAPAATFTTAAVGMRIRLAGGLAANNGDFTITEFVSDTSVKIANVSAVVDATVQTFQGVIEVGPSWYDNATLTVSAAAPSSASPYIVVQCCAVPVDVRCMGKPAGLRISFTDCEMQTANGLGTGMEVTLTTCQMTQGGLLAGGPNTDRPLQSHLFSTLCSWRNPGAGFGSLIFQESGINRFFDGLFVGYNLRYREGPVGPLVISNAMIQGGYLGPAGEEAGPRPGSSSGWAPQGARGLAVFNNINGSSTNPAGSTGSAGFGICMARETRGTCSGVVWGVGALGGIHIKENSRLMSIPTITHKITDTAGLAGYAIQEVKLDDQPGIPTPSATTGVPTAVTVSVAGAATTFTAADGLVTIVDAGMAFTAASVGRTLTIAGANTPANNGTYPIVSFVGATSVVIRNPAGVTDAVAAGSTTENPVVTRWTQLNAAPYSGFATSYKTGAKAFQIAGS